MGATDILINEMNVFIILFLVLATYYTLNFLSIAMINSCGTDKELVWIKLIFILLFYINRVFALCGILYCIYEIVDLLLR